MRKDGLINVRKIVEKVLDAQFRERRITIRDLLPSEYIGGDQQASDGAVYNALKVLTKAEILIRRYMSGRQRSLEIDFNYAYEQLALYNVIVKATAVAYLPEDARVEIMKRHFLIMRSDAISELKLIYELKEKYRDTSEDSYKVHKYILASAVENVMQFIENWAKFQDPVKYINYMILSETQRNAFEQMLATRDGANRSDQERI